MPNHHSLWSAFFGVLASPAFSIVYGIIASALFTVLRGFWVKFSQQRRQGKKAVIQAQIDRAEKLRTNDQFTTWMVTHFMFQMVRSTGVLVIFIFVDQIWSIGFPKVVEQISNAIAKALSGWFVVEFLFAAYAGAEYNEIFFNPKNRIDRLKKKLARISPVNNSESG